MPRFSHSPRLSRQTVNTLPLISSYRPEAVLAWHGGRPVAQGQFLAAALALAQRLPEARHAINLCKNQCAFAMSFAAACLRGQTNLLPLSPAPGAIAELKRNYSESYVLDDALAGEINLNSEGLLGVPGVPVDHVAAIAFTSGSTGEPQPHRKTWQTLVATGHLAAERFFQGRSVHLVGTVPPQHMYGLETSIMMGLAAGCSAYSERPVFPEDLRVALEKMPEPRVLVTTPVHLRACVEARVPLPRIELVISSTAPLPKELAAAIEQIWQTPVREIYGCTEAGSLASRRTMETEVWQLHPHMYIEVTAQGASLIAAHLQKPVPLPDQLEIQDSTHFRLIGRAADMIKVAGKRASLSGLTQTLLAIPGVQDGVVFLPEDRDRPAALVVAPRRSERAILTALAERLDPVFLPRPLRKVDKLPRNEMGKLRNTQMQQLLAV